MNFANEHAGLGAEFKVGHGGKRPGSGPKPGFDALKQHMKLREMVAAAQDAMVEAQIKSAMGISYLVSRDRKTGKFTKITEEEAKLRLKDRQKDSEIIEVWEERPNTLAFTDLMNRTLGKPKEEVEAKVSGGLDITWKVSE